MPACIKCEQARKSGRFMWTLLLLVSGAVAAFAASPEGYFGVRHAQTRLADDVYRLDASFTWELSEETRKALRSNIPLPLVLDIRVKRRRFLWDETVAALELRYELDYHALTGEYSVTYLNTGVEKVFPGLNDAIGEISEVMDFPLLDQHLIDKGKTYSVQLKTYLDIEGLPVPLRTVAYFSSQWRLAGSVYTCPLDP